MAARDDDSSEWTDIALAILLALVALTAALAAWRTSVVGSNAAGENRTGLLDTIKQQASDNIDQGSAYLEATYAVKAAVESAAATAMQDSDRPALRAAGANIGAYAVPGLEKLAGPFPAGNLMTDLGTFDVPARVAELQAETAAKEGYDPQASFRLARTYSDEKQWLTVISVTLAIALFWLGLAEITANRARMTNMVIGISVWAIGLGGFVAVELYAMSTRGGVL